MKLPELKSKFKNRYAIRIIAGVLIVTLVATGSLRLQCECGKGRQRCHGDRGGDGSSEETEDTEDAESSKGTVG